MCSYRKKTIIIPLWPSDARERQHRNSNKVFLLISFKDVATLISCSPSAFQRQGPSQQVPSAYEAVVAIIYMTFNQVTATRGLSKATTLVWLVPRCVLSSKRMAIVTWERVLPSRGDVTQLRWPLSCQPSGQMASCLPARRVGICQGQKDQAFFQID